ncbi:MAG: quaternary ammonium compound efflux SMR transporter SugE [Phycisphaeraceae bacterium]
MPWLILVFAGLLEAVWAIAMKYSDGFTRLWPSVVTALAMIASVILLARAMRALPLGTAYAVWTGIGAVAAAIAGIFLFQESHAPLRLTFLALIILGLVGLQMTTK